MEKSTVLVVEDDPETLATVRDVLDRADFNVLTATTGREALGRLLDAEQPAVIVLDLRMPVMDGRELLTIARAYHRLASIPVLLLTAMELDAKISKSVDMVMRKPFRADELVANVSALARVGMRSAAE
jgi:CheY-like chemotaxis protein